MRGPGRRAVAGLVLGAVLAAGGCSAGPGGADGAGAEPGPSRTDADSGARASDAPADGRDAGKSAAYARTDGGTPSPRGASGAAADPAATDPAGGKRPPSPAMAVLQGPRLTPAETSQFIAGLLTVSMERRVQMADTLYRCGFADALLPPHLWVFVQRVAGRDMDSGILTEMGFGFHLVYTHFTEPVLFWMIEELNHGTAYHKFELDHFLQCVTLQFEDVPFERFRDKGWVSKRANGWLRWLAAHEHENRMDWAMAALEQRPLARPARLFQVLEDVTGLKPFAEKVDPDDPADVAKRCDWWRSWWAAHREYVYWFEEEIGPVTEPFPAWWDSARAKAERERGLFRVDAAARAAGVPSATYRRTNPWPHVPRR